MKNKAACLARPQVLVIAVLVSLGASTFAQAVTVIPAVSVGSSVGSVQLLSADGTNTSNNTCAFIAGCTGSATATASYGGGVAAGTLVASSSGVSTGNSVSAGLNTTYYFEVLGPTSTSVALFFSGSGATSATGNASVSVTAGQGLTLFGNACSASGTTAGACGSNASSFSGAYGFSVPSNTLASVSLNITGYMVNGSGSFSASFDPSITLAPGLAAQGYSLVFSPDPVPLPASAWLLVSALGGLGLFMRRGHRAASRVARVA